MDMLYNMV